MSCDLCEISHDARMAEMSPDWLNNQLRNVGKNRKWLAEKLFLSSRTIDKWFEKGIIPLKKRELIKKILGDAEEKSHTEFPEIKSIVLEFTPEQYVVVKAEAERRGLTVEEWAAEVLHSLASVTVRVRS